MTSISQAPLVVAATVQSLAAEAISLQARITELRESLVLLDLQIRSMSDTLHRLRAVGAEHRAADVAVSPIPSSGT
ncbi:hypothetical protein OG978_03630 [Streptomyces sp. NBC_01591]|uniref:hypothetical protein n=1 Tax=Streptomyces sp. NBC_01591 TaxID=2975888 RepID=UPI002DDB8518|nr:hypothetical protein [Streptomyces sp. NBC_01591]WSD66548.1 hypothetical protein OG978_03630 [Streptomyces sp. NBC_01591]